MWTSDLKDGKIQSSFYERRKFMFGKQKGQRHAVKQTKAEKEEKKNRNIPLFSLWQGQRLTYLEARRAIYYPLYIKLVHETDEYKELVKMLEDGINIQIIGYDGYDIQTDLETCMKDPSRPCGHEVVLACDLMGQTL